MLRFEPEALEEFLNCDKAVREFFKGKLEQRLSNPLVAKDALGRDLHGLFKIKQNSSGFRLVY